MKWVDALVDSIRPTFGGIYQIVQDPDHLLDVPDVREALRGRGMTLIDWDGESAMLPPLKFLRDSEMPLLVVGDNGFRHTVEASGIYYSWLPVGVAALMPRFAPEIVRSIPPERWDSLLILHGEIRGPLTPSETATLIARALYGIDPEFLRHGDGWIRLLTRMAVAEEALPKPIARILSGAGPPPWSEAVDWEALAEPAGARATLSAILTADPLLSANVPRTEQLLIAEFRASYSTTEIAISPTDLLAVWDEHSRSSEGVLQFGLAHAAAQDAAPFPPLIRREIDRHFVNWLKINYGLLQSTANPAVLRLPSLLNTLENEFAKRRFVLFVVDSLGLAAWERVRKRWLADGIIGSAHTRAAFAVLPTITTLSRRALFEGKPPSQFSSEPHSPRLERTLWAARYKTDGAYFHESETQGFADSLAQGLSRICCVDIKWDKKGHSIDPHTDSVAEAANIWAAHTPLRELISAALGSGCHVLLTSDHGQTECVGMGRLSAGELSEERSKRVMIFNDRSVLNNMQQVWTDSFRPSGLPPDMFPLFAADFHSFDLTGVASISHGGMSLEEVLVPVVELRA